MKLTIGAEKPKDPATVREAVDYLFTFADVRRSGYEHTSIPRDRWDTFKRLIQEGEKLAAEELAGVRAELEAEKRMTETLRREREELRRFAEKVKKLAHDELGTPAKVITADERDDLRSLVSGFLVDAEKVITETEDGT